MGTIKTQALLVPHNFLWPLKRNKPPMKEMDRWGLFLQNFFSVLAWLRWCVQFRHLVTALHKTKYPREWTTEMKTTLSVWFGLRKGLTFLIKTNSHGPLDQWEFKSPVTTWVDGPGEIQVFRPGRCRTVTVCSWRPVVKGRYQHHLAACSRCQQPWMNENSCVDLLCYIGTWIIQMGTKPEKDHRP